MCGLDEETREVAELAIAGNDAALDEFNITQLETADDALFACFQHDCDNHGSERHARDAVRAAIVREKARIEERLQVEADARSHGGACGCSECC